MSKKKYTTGLFLVLLLVLSAYVWRFIPQQVIRGDGFVYLISRTQEEFFSRPYFYTGFELSAATLGWLLPKLFGIQISLYWWLAYVVMLITNAFFYWFALAVFKRPFFAFTAALLFSTSYFGNWGMYSSHCYCFFIERIIPVLFLLPAARYLHQFLEKRKRRDGFLSILLYFIGVGIGHWSVFATAFFLFYPISWSLFSQKEKQRIKTTLFGFIYLGITVFFVLIQRIHEPGFTLKYSAIEFFLHPGTYRWPEQIIRQFVYWTQYPVLLQGNFDMRINSKINDISSIISITPYILATYGIVFFIIYRFLPKRRVLLIASLVGTISLFYVNALFGQYDVLNQPDANRYLYYPTMLLSLFWTLVVEALISQKKKLFSILAVLLLVGYLSINMRLIREGYIDSQYYNFLTKKVFSYIQKKAPELAPGTLIVAPYDEVGVYEAIFFTEQLKPKGITVMSSYNTYSNVGTWESAAKKSPHLIILEKESSCRCIRENVVR